MPRGCLDRSTAGAVEREVLRLCAAGVSSIAVDLRALQFNEPAGGRLLRRLSELAGRHDVTLAPAPSRASSAAPR
jgi:anti-anti-sigma regulatory factor